MGFLDEVAAETKRPVGDKFTAVCEALGEECGEFLEALDDPRWPATALEKVLAARGIVVSDSSLLVWRRKRAAR